MSSQGITIFKGKDNKSVNLMSNYHPPIESVSVQRNEKYGTITTVPCPKVIIEYNAKMNFVDNFD